MLPDKNAKSRDRLLGNRRSGPAVHKLLAAGVALLVLASDAAAAPPHPLDPLSADELAKIKSILKQSGEFSRNTDFSWIQLAEPAKSIVSRFSGGADFPRRAYLAVIDFDRKKSFDVIVDLRAGKIASLKDLDGFQPALTEQDDAVAREIVDADPAIKAALIKRGFRIPGRTSDAVSLQFAPVGRDPVVEFERGRLLRVLFVSHRDAINEFGPLADGIMAVVDLFNHRVVKLVDIAAAPTAKVPHDIFRPEVRGPPIPAKPVIPSRPSQRNFAVDGNVISWRQWQFRFAFNQREGVVLYQIALKDSDRKRAIAYRASVAEVVTTYLDNSEFWSWLELFDEGAFGLGNFSIDVRAGREVPANAVTIAAVMPDPTKARFSEVLRDRIYVYERDAGGLMLYRQGDLTLHARATELVVGLMASLGNYVYAFNWLFRQDGSFGFEVELAGKILTKPVAASECELCKALAAGPWPDGASRTFTSSGDDRFGTLIYPNLVGTNHQHWFNLRIDFDLDGTANAVMENNFTQPTEGGGHDRGSSMDRWTGAHTVFGRAADAKRDVSHHTARSWTIYNPSSLRRTGRPAGYTAMPGENAAPLFGGSREKEPVGFAFHHFWVTPYRDGQLYAGGAHPNQALRDYSDTLYHYANDDPIYNRDIVVWYSMGTTHLPRPEDYPVMSNMKMSVFFRPDGFFDRNAALGAGEVSGHLGDGVPRKRHLR